MEFEEIMKRISELEKVAERSKEESAELDSLKRAFASKDEELKIAKREAKLLKRNEEFRELGKDYGASDELLRSALDDENMTKEDFMRSILDSKKEQSPDVVVGGVQNEDSLKRSIEDTLAYRMGGDIPEDTSFIHAGVVDMARNLIGGSYSMSPDDIYERSMTTGTLPGLLGGSINRVLEKQFDEYPVTYKKFVNEIDLPDFRQVERYTKLTFGAMDAITEGSALNEKNWGESKETLKLKQFGNKLEFTREMFINSDLFSLNTGIGDLAESASKRAEFNAYNTLMAGVLSDGTSIYDPTHSNTGAFNLDEDGLASARTLMARQKASDGSALMITPKYIVVAPEDEIKAKVLIMSTGSTVNSKNAGVVNPHANTLEIIVSPLLSAGQWYLLAGRRTITAAYLLGSGRKPKVKVFNNTITKTTFEAVFDFATGADDYRGFVRAN